MECGHSTPAKVATVGLAAAPSRSILMAASLSAVRAPAGTGPRSSETIECRVPPLHSVLNCKRCLCRGLRAPTLGPASSKEETETLSLNSNWDL
jgi:hypothetical protein